MKSNFENMINWFKQLFCIHDYKMIGSYPMIPDLKQGETFAFSRDHECRRCGKVKRIGSGMIS